MKFLFVHQNFPGQFLHLARHLAASKQHEVVFITEPNANQIGGVRKVPYNKPLPASAATHVAVRELDIAVRRAEVVAAVARNLKSLGFVPDIMIGHHGWGEMMNLVDVFPGVPLLGYQEFYYQIDGIDVNFDPEFPTPVIDYPRIRAKNAINHITLNLGQHGQTPTEWQLSTYPDWARPQITLLREGVHLDVCKPDPAVRTAPLKVGDMTIRPKDKLVTYVSRDLEPYRGFHVMMRALPHLLRARKDLRVVMIGGDGVSYGNAPAEGAWRQVMLKEVGDRIDMKRVVFPGRLDYQDYLAVLQRSDAHVYLTYPFVASWSLRESLATGCVVIGSDTQPVREFITPGVNGLLTSFFDPAALARTVLNVLEDADLSRRLRENARRYAERHLAMADYLAEYEALISRLTGMQLAAPQEETVVPLRRPARRARR
ncbi:MAG TPA: glycosyltransferase [Acetobacteraceae bacterium]|nr:glycosyltransferase [Acetobacteraceae bacterium]